MFKIGLPFQFREQKSTLKKYSHMSTKIHDYSLQEFGTEKKKKKKDTINTSTNQ